MRLREGRSSEGAAFLEESLKLAKSTGVVDPYYLPDILLDYAGAVLMNGDLKHAQSLFRQSLEGVPDSMPRIPSRLEGLAKAARMLGDKLRAVKLLGTAHAMREKMSLQLPPVYQAGYDHELSDLRNTLGESAFQQAWKPGSAMTVDKSVEFALEESWLQV